MQIAKIMTTATLRRMSITREFSLSNGLLKGHSKWQNIKATKGKNDMLKSQAMNVLLKKTKAAALRGGFDVKLNRELSALEQDCRAQGLSLDTFRNFLTKLKDKPEIECTYNVIGPSGSFFIIEAETDNRKVFENTLRKYFNKVGGFRLAAETSAVQSWFQRKGVVTVKAELKGKEVHLDQMEEIGIELDCEDVTLVEDKNPLFELLCEPGKLSDVESTLSSKGFIVESAEIQFRPRHPIHIAAEDASKVGKLYELLQEAEIFHEFHTPSSHSMYTLSRDTLQIFAVLQALVFSSGRNAEEDDSIRQIFDNIQPST